MVSIGQVGLSNRKKTILYWVAIVVLFALFIGFLVAFITTKNANKEDTVTTTPGPTTTPRPSEEEIRLDDNAIPTHYALEVTSDHENNLFNGTISIDINVKASINQLRIHCKGLELKDYQLVSNAAGATPVDIKSLTVDTRLELCVFASNGPIAVGSYKLTIFYTGLFNDGQITGFYKSTYTTVDNQRRYLTATKFEPTYARMAFPCFDEPKFKATWDISIVHPSDLIALSNEIEESTVPVAVGWSKTTFKQTVPMVTYLVAFIVSDFKYTETRTARGTRVRVYSRPDQVEKTTYATDTAATVLRYYEDYTGIPYALNKLDLIGLPEFVSGAMENWGLVTYKETYVLYSATDSSAADMRSIAAVISHELAHMWFGNLVTLKWWNDLWLNEGFASYFEYKGQDLVNKSWNMFDRFPIDDLHPAFRADVGQSIHPVVNNALTPDEITAIFDTITYSKGAAILNMVEYMIGEAAFKQSSVNYLNAYKFGVAETAELLPFFKDAIKAVTNIDGDKFLNKYLFSNSFPILTVTRSGSNSLQITQTAYNANQSLVLDEPWNIYVAYALPNNRQGSFVLDQVTQTVQLPTAPEANEWIKLNKDSTGYYIVNYQLSDWKLLIDQLNDDSTALPDKDKASILFDAYQLSNKKLLTYETLFSLFDYLKNENDYLPWSVASSAFSSIRSKLTSTSSFSLEQWNAFITRLVSGVFDAKVDFSADPSTLTYEQIVHRNVLISLACSVDYANCISQANVLFRNWLDNGVPVDPNIRSYVYSYGISSTNNANDWRRIWNMYQSESDALEKSKLMSALTSATSSTLLLTLISYSHDPAVINNENFFTVQQNIASSSENGRALVWDYIKNNWDYLVARFTLNDRRLGNYVRSVTGGFGTTSRLNEMEDFFARYPDAGAGAAARVGALETVRQNIEWAEENEPQISSVLSARDESANPWLTWRLNEFIRPVHYNVSLNIDVDAETFSGQVSIQVNVQKPIEYLIVHSNGLTNSSSNLYTQADRTLVSEDNKGFLDVENQFWVIPMKQIISAGQYIAEFTFSSKLSTSMTGLYVSQYVSNETNLPVKLATTQFQAGYARKAFPCFDEPQFKATFTISITHASKYTALSNMPVDHVQTDSITSTTVFMPTVRMSTYLVAMVVSDFSSKRSTTSPDFSVYTYNPSINLAKVDYALTVGPQILDFFAKDYFKIAYPLPKTDMISIPDFSAGAMENWGLITYRDVYILYDEKDTTSASKMTICMIIAHELAHMWYGNLVTIKWWDNLWLNEGFAEFMQYKATAAVEPSWNYNEHFVIEELNRVFDLDSTLSTHPILMPVRNENEMQSIFDPITYAKGASVIRMLENTVGEENFRAAVSNYLNKYAYNNTVTTDLWAEFDTVLAGQQIDVSTIMDTWVKREGFPVVTVTGGANGAFSLQQEQFLKDFNYANTTYTWYIPLTYQVIDTNNPDLINPIGRVNFTTRTSAVTIPGFTSTTTSLIKFNIDQTGIVIVNYPTAQWNLFISQLNDNSSIAWQRLSTLDRNNLLNDAFYLSRSGRLSYDVTLRLIPFLRYERTFVVWQTASTALTYLRTFAISQDQGIAFNQWLLNSVIGTLYDELGWDAAVDENLNVRRLRALILDLTCRADHQACLQTAAQKFDEFQQTVESNNGRLLDEYYPDPDTFNVFLFHTMRAITATTQRSKFDFLLKQYETVLSTNEKMRYLRALAAVQSEALLQELVSKSLDTTFIRAQDYFTFLQYLSSSTVGLNLAWNSFRDNFPTLQERYGLDNTDLGRAIYRFASAFTSADRRAEVTEFYAKYPRAGAGELYRKQALELIDANVEWTSKYYNLVAEHLTTRCDSAACPWNVFRLTNSVVPSEYYLTIQVNTNSYLYNGTVKALVNVVSPVSYIIVHAASILTPSKPSVLVGGTQYSTGTGFVYPPLEFYVIPLTQQLPTGAATVEISFEGNLLLGGTVGLYRGWYEDDTTNSTVNLAATQFESTHARKVFPFFDEPHFKQVIHMSIIHEDAMTMTLTNMPAVSTVAYAPIPGWQITTYEPTVKMVTYLIAILVSDFQCSSVQAPGIGPNGAGVKVSTCASKVFQAHKHGYSLEITPGVLKHYETLLDQPYQITKLDQVALPQFSPGAMENWGLVKYREVYLLWTDDEETSTQQRSVANIIAHELAHMWFGNLLTCDFWGELWLNEAFASYMEFAAVAAIHPEWNYFDSIVYYNVFNAMLSDSTGTSKEIVRENLASPSDIGSVSAIIYDKGSSVLHMFNTTMGAANFRTSLQNYLRKHAYTSVVTAQLFSEFAENWNFAGSATQDATLFLRSWTYQPGFPYLNITYDSASQTYTYTQERFLQSGNRPNDDLIYVIPFSYYTLNAKTRALEQSSVQFLNQKTGTLPVGFANSVKVNPAFNGFYLVNYPEAYWTELSDKLLANSNDFVNSLMVNDRAELLVSSFLLARARLLPYMTPFKLYRYLINEKHFVPWYYYDYAVSYLALRIGRTEYRESFNQFERRLTSAHYTGLSFWDDSQGMNFDKQFRTLLITITCRSGTQQCLKDAYTKFQAFKNANGDVAYLPPNLRANILNYGVKQSTDPSDYAFVWQQYIKEVSTSPLKTIYLQAISYISDWDTLKTYIDASLDETLVSPANFVTFFNYITANYAHESNAWRYFVDNNSMFVRKLTAAQVNSIVAQFANYAVTTARRNEINAFLTSTANVGTAAGRTSALSTADSNIAFLNTRKTEVGQWFTSNGCGDIADKTPKACPWGSLRIDKTTSEPTGYNVVIQVNMTTFIYNGTVDINVRTTAALDFVTLHAADILTVNLISVTDSSGAKVGAQLFRYSPQNYVVVQFDQQQQTGDYVFSLGYRGSLLDGGLSGLYLSNYTDTDGSRYGVASTQFEFYDARKVFPCFDEPAFKTKFTMTIVHDLHMNATLANMDLASSKVVDGMPAWIETKYHESLPMPTYLVAILVSDYVCAEKTDDGVHYRICAARMYQHKLDYALQLSPKVLQYLETLTEFKNQLKKVDQVAIPDFYYGAMENWGLITYRETGLLFSEEDTTTASKFSIASVIAHEMAHFWFGNLVTCEWWDQLWLNESFARFMEYLVINVVEPTWNYMDLFLMNVVDSAMSTDSGNASPVIRPISTTAQIDAFSSGIVYAKGASVLRMLRYIMTPDKFHLAVANYLKDNAFQTARDPDLISKFDEQFPAIDGVTKATDFLEQWIRQSGFPYLNVTKEGDTYRVQQERFTLTAGLDKSTVWKVPLTYYTSGDYSQNDIQMVTSANQLIANRAFPADGLIKFNSGHNGFYLTNYPADLWAAWTDALVTKYAETNLPIADRAGLLMDSFYLARANLLPYTTPLKLARYLVNENHLTPWTFAIRGFNLISKYALIGSDDAAVFVQYIQDLITPIYTQVGWDDSQGTDTYRRLRATILDFACEYNVADCWAKAGVQFALWKDGVNTNDESKYPRPNLFGTVLKYGLKSAPTTENWQFVWTQYIKEKAATRKSQYLTALANTQNQESISALLGIALEASAVPSSDSASIFTAIVNSKNKESLEAVWQFVKTNYAKLSSGSPLTQAQLSTLINNIATQYFFTTTRRTELQTFLSASGGLSTSQQNNALNTVNSNIAWIAARFSEVENFLLCDEQFCPFTEFRLTDEIYPDHYTIKIEVDLENDRFIGKTEITAQVSAAAQHTRRYVVLHAAPELEISYFSIWDLKTRNRVVLKRTFRYEKYGFMVIELVNPIPYTEIEIDIEYESPLSTDMRGFYLSQYYDPASGNMVKLASTQFQDTYARRAFPCFDEPYFKSFFHVTLITAPQYTATMSNTQIRSIQTLPDGRVQTDFASTPHMVTYLLAFVVSDFACQTNQTVDNVDVTVCSSPAQIANTEYAVEKSPAIIDVMSDKFKNKYSLAMHKMHLVAIPDFSAGAMENWGLLTFRETALLWNPQTSSAYDKVRVASVVAHEIAHMWFGNLITCEWWADLWLNEAFASYMEWFSVADIEPTWDYWQQFYVYDFIPGLNADARTSAHPLVRVDVNSPAAIGYVSNIIYEKGSTVLRMFEFVLGTEGFYDAVDRYIQAHAYTSVPSYMLLDTLSQVNVANLNTTDFIYSWTTQAGIPYINITVGTAANQYIVTQERFFANGRVTTNTQTWLIPLTYYANYEASNAHTIEYITEKTQSITVHVSNPALPIKFNYDTQGYYMVNYPPEEWTKWIQLFGEENHDGEVHTNLKLTPQDYSQVLYDAFSLSGAALLPYTTALALTPLLHHNEMFSVWYTGGTVFSQLLPYFRTSETAGIGALMQTSFNAYAQYLVQPVYVKYGLTTSDPVLLADQRMRSEVNAFACAYGLEMCLFEAQAEFKKWRSTGVLPAPNVRPTVLRYAIQESKDDSDWNYLWNVYVQTYETSLKLDYLQGLAQSSNRALLNLLFERANDQNLVRRQDYLSLFAYAVRTQTGFDVAWSYYTANYKSILANRLTAGQMGTVAGYFARYLNTAQQKSTFQKFFADNTDTGVSAASLTTALETIDRNIFWVNTYRPTVYEWLRVQNVAQ